MPLSLRKLWLWLLLSPLLASPAFAAEAEYFSGDRLEQLAAPIALYPDALVAQVLMAATYPLQVAQAARWQQGHAGLRDKDLDRAAAGEPWDPSVKSLLHFPDLLRRMNENLDWTKDLGDAVLARQPDVMQAIQRLRRYAYEAGNLKDSVQQRVVVEEQVIRVEPATEVIYVPAYNPTVVYGSYWAPASWYYPLYGYPSVYWYPFGYFASDAISFGIGVFAGVALWGHCDWHDGWIGYHGHHDHWRGYPDRRHGGDFHGNHGPSPGISRWEHNPINRHGVGYRDPQTARHFDGVRRDMTGRGPGAGPAGLSRVRPGGPGVRTEAPRGYDLMGRRSAVPQSSGGGPRSAASAFGRPGAASGDPGMGPAGSRTNLGRPDGGARAGRDKTAMSSPRGGTMPDQGPRASKLRRGEQVDAPSSRGQQPSQPMRSPTRPSGALQTPNRPRGAAQIPSPTQGAIPAPGRPQGSMQAPAQSRGGAPSYRSSAGGKGGLSRPQAVRGMGGAPSRAGSTPRSGGPGGGRGGTR